VEDLTDIERELMLISRHHLLTSGTRESGMCLDRSAYVLLNRLEAEGPMSIRQLAESFRLDTSTVNRQTAALLRDDLAERIPDPDGGLARKLRITERGAHSLAEDRIRHRDMLRHVFDDWSPDEIDQLTTALTRFNSSIERLEARPWPRPTRTGS